MSDAAAFHAANKFGLGIQPGELSLLASDPKGWLLAQLPKITHMPARYTGLPDSAALITEADQDYRERLRLQQNGTVSAEGLVLIRQGQRKARAEQQKQVNLRLAVAIESDTPFAERLVRFWSNHFTIAISNNKPTLAYAGLAWENEAIRTNLGGRFEDLLIAATRHPVMLTYLDNHVSIGPNSPFGRQTRRGLNENLARELLELHSLGVAGGYTQDDVVALARMLTGWTVNLPLYGANRLDMNRTSGSFLFHTPLHEPGTQTFLGQTFPNTGEQQATSALRAMASHPSTAVHVATELARHFIADQPPQSAIDQLARVFAQTQGDLPSVHKALVELDEAWDTRWRKVKSAEDFVVSTVRALPGIPLTDDILTILNDTLRSFNQTPFTATSPAGWPEQAEHWAGPDALMKRIEFINMVAQATGPDFDARELAPLILPADTALQTAVRRSESKTQALAVLLASPQFQWRA